MATNGPSCPGGGNIPAWAGDSPALFMPGKEGDAVMKAARKLTVAVKPIPEGYHSITPMLTVRGADRAIDFYRRAFGAEEIGRMHGPDGKTVMHAELKIGDSRFFLGDEACGMDTRSPQTLGGSPTGMYLYVRDVDEVFHKAVAAGATVKRPLENMFWGDRTGSVLDPYGHTWDLATHREDVPPEEMKRRGEEFARKMKAGKT
jgi:PhnB protein